MLVPLNAGRPQDSRRVDDLDVDNGAVCPAVNELAVLARLVLDEDEVQFRQELAGGE